jgi:hypothetical protein
MTRLRLLLALLLIGVGTTFGALALSGYYEPHLRHGQAAAAPAIPAQPVDKPQLSLWLPKHGFAADVAKPAAKPQAKAKAAVKAEAAKPRAPAQAVTTAKDKRPQAAAAPWPWNLLGI